MPGHRYERISHSGSEENDHLHSLSAHNNASPDQHQPVRSYYTGLPSTAPPSFHSIANTPSLPHRSDETAATIIPPSSRPLAMAEDNMSETGISLWGSSDITTDSERSLRERNLEAALIQCLDRIAVLEARLDASNGILMTKDEVDLESSRRKERLETRDGIIVVVSILAFIVGSAWWVLALVKARHGTGSN